MPVYIDWLNSHSKDSAKSQTFKKLGKSVNPSKVKNREVGYVIKGKYFPLIDRKTKGATTIKWTKKITKEYEDLIANPTRENYARISTEITGLAEEFFIDLYDYANKPEFNKKNTWDAGYTGVVAIERRGANKRKEKEEREKKAEKEEYDEVIDLDKPKPKPKKKMRGGKTGEEEMPTNIEDIQIESRPRTLDPDKYKDSTGKLKEGFEDVGGKILRVDLLKKGDFGYVFRGQLFPIFKVDELALASNSWSFVSNKMLPQEKELFKRMGELDEGSAISLYYDYFDTQYNIPKKVIGRALQLANNDFTKKKIRNLERNLGEEAVRNGFNINYKGKGIFETLTGFIKKKTPEQERSEDKREIMSMSKEEIKDLFDNKLAFNTRTKPSQESKQGDVDGVITEEELKTALERENRRLTPSAREPPEITTEPETDIPQRERRAEEEQLPQQADASLRANIQPPPQTQPQPPQAPQAPPPQNIRMDITEQKRGEALRLEEKAKIGEQEQDMKEEMEKDNIPDISKYGHQLAVQNIFKKNNKDFTYFKKLISTSKSLQPSQNKAKRKITTDIIIAEYSSLFPIDNIKSDYDYEECLEIATFKYCYVENVRFEKRWKKAISNMNIGTPQNKEGLTPGVILNLENMGLNVNQLLNPSAIPTGNNKPPVAPTDPKKRETAGRIEKLDEYNIVRPPQKLQNKNTRKRRQVKFKDVNMNIRKRTISNKLLFTNLNHQPQQQNIEIPGDLPTFNFRNNEKKNRFKF